MIVSSLFKKSLIFSSILVLSLGLVFAGLSSCSSPSTALKSATRYDFNLTYELKDPSQIQIQSLVDTLNHAKSGDVVVLHVGQYGGDGEAMQYILTAMKNTKAKTVAIVEAPSYSAHALIAGHADVLIMNPGTFLMFHTTSIYGLDCDALDPTQKDRGHDPRPKCKQFVQANTYSANYEIDQVKILTPEEKHTIETGYDVYLTAEEINIRQHSMSWATVAPVILDSDVLPDISGKITVTASKG